MWEGRGESAKFVALAAFAATEPAGEASSGTESGGVIGTRTKIQIGLDVVANLA